MADNTAVYGFRWVGSLIGKNVVPTRERVQSGYQGSPGGNNIDLFPGDPVIRVTGSGNNPGGVIIATTTTVGIAGVIVGIGPYFAAAPISAMVPGGTQLPGGTTYGTKFERESTLWVVPSVGAIFEGDVDDNTTFTTEIGYKNAIGKNVDITINNVAGDTHAYPKLKISSQATTNTLQARILDVSPTLLNQDFSGKNVKLLFTFNIVQEAPYAPLGV
jgi:hypothetical protein